jgi:UDP-2,3-diacylglucosamine hydrolase
VSKTVGLIAGNGKLPLLLARNLRRAGRRVVAAAHVGETRKDLGAAVDALRWVRIGQFDSILRFFREEGAAEVLLAGGVSKTHFFSRLQPDARALRIFSRLKDKKDDALLRAIADEVESEGMRVVGPADFLQDHLAPRGCWSARPPTEREEKDIAFGWELARQMGALDVGQSVVVKDQIILAVEAIEGTDAAILRGGKWGRGGVTVVKICKPTQDPRLDPPVIGPKTVRVLHRAGGALLAVEAGKTLILDREKIVREADRNALCLYGL